MKTLFDTIPWVVVVPWIIANVIPYLSALATRAPSWATGAVTAALSILTSFLSELVGKADFDWKVAAVNSFVTFGIAFMHHKAFLSGTQLQAELHAKGNSTPAPA